AIRARSDCAGARIHPGCRASESSETLCESSRSVTGAQPSRLLGTPCVTKCKRGRLRSSRDLSNLSAGKTLQHIRLVQRNKYVSLFRNSPRGNVVLLQALLNSQRFAVFKIPVFE